MFDWFTDKTLLYPYSKEVHGKNYVVFNQWETIAGKWYLAVEIDPEAKIPYNSTKVFSPEFIFEAKELEENR